MSKNYISLELGGKLRGLKFSMITLEIFQERTGKEPLTELGTVKNENFKEFKAVIYEIYYAALLANCQAKKERPDFTEDEAREWFDDLHPVYLYKIIQAYNLPQEEPSANGEAGKEKPVTFS